ncbi:MAG: flagellar transcriptional regulator FlhC [Hydrogenophilus sp.]|nr:flagellar transcriptional regulator FlhC [Hydrogenophilus sp.]
MVKRVDAVEAEAQEIMLAAELIRLGARMQLLEAEIALSRERLLKLYKQVRGVSPPKGMLPFSADWFMTWQPNVHSTLFANLWLSLKGSEPRRRLINAYQLYLDGVDAIGVEPILSVTRAWTLLRFIDADILQLTPCRNCGGHFVTHAYEPAKQFVCGLCHMPSRAIATRKSVKHAITVRQRMIPIRKNRRRTPETVG